MPPKLEVLLDAQDKNQILATHPHLIPLKSLYHELGLGCFNQKSARSGPKGSSPPAAEASRLTMVDVEIVFALE